LHTSFVKAALVAHLCLLVFSVTGWWISGSCIYDINQYTACH